MTNNRIRPQFSVLGFNFGDPLSLVAAQASPASVRLDWTTAATGFADTAAQPFHNLETERVSPFGGHAVSSRELPMIDAAQHRTSHVSLPAAEAQQPGSQLVYTTLLGVAGSAAISESSRGIFFAHDFVMPDSPAVVRFDSFSPVASNLVLPHAVRDVVSQVQLAVPKSGPFHTNPVIGGQLWFGVADANNTHSGLDHIDTDAAGYDVADHPTSGGNIASMAVDGASGLYFAYGRDDMLRSGHITNDIEAGQASEIQETDMVFGSGGSADEVNAIAIDPLNHILFVGLFGQSDQFTGILEVQYNPATGALTNPYNAATGVVTDLNHMLFRDDNNGHVNGSAISNTNIVAMQYDMQNSTLYYVDQSNGHSFNFGSGTIWNATNGVYSVSTAGSVGGGTAPTPTLLTLNSQFAAGDNNNYIEGMAINEAQGIIYLAVNNASTSTSKIFWMPIAGGTATQIVLPGGTLGFADNDDTGVNPLAFDPNLRQLYVSDNSDSQLVQLTLSADGHTVTSSNSDFLTIDHSIPGSGPTGLFFDPLPTLSTLTATTTEALQGGSALTLLTAPPSITDPQDGASNKLHMGYLQVVIANAQSGDQLFYSGAQSGPFDSGKMTISWNSSTHTLTLTGNETEAAYDTFFQNISYQDTGTDNSTGSHPTRTIDWIISDGTTIVNQTTASSNEKATTVVIDRAPTLTSDNYAVLESATSTGTSGTGGTGVLGNDTDKDADAIVITAVNGSGANVGFQIAGTYGHLTLNANGSFSYLADNTASIDAAPNGSHPVDTFTYTVSDGLGGVTTTTVTFTIDRAPTVVADSGAAVESLSGTGNVLTNDSDKDGDSLTVTAVNGSGANVGSATFQGTYGHFNLAANGGYTYTADNTSAIDAAATGSHLTDTFTYTAGDGHSGTTTTTITITLDRPPTVVTDSGAAVESASGAGNVLTNDSDRDSDSLTVSAVNGSGANLGNFVAGTYGHLKINADGSYTYNADNTSAIDAAATGSHLTDAFTYTASDTHGGTTNSTITITLDRPPTVSTHNVSVAESATASGTGGIAGTGSLSGDSDRDSDAIQVSKLNGNTINDTLSNFAGTYGHLTIGNDGSYSYVADNTSAIDAAPTGSHPVDAFTLTVDDGHGGTSSETLNFSIDRAAIAQGDSISTTESSTVTASTVGTGLLGNDSDPDTGTNAGLSVTAVNGSAGNVGNQITFADGSFITVNADGTYTYDPNHAWDFLPAAASGAPSTGTETFQYTVTGGSTVTVTITINGQDSNDTLQGSAGADTYNGGIGDDTFNMQDGGVDNVSGGSGNDFIKFGASLTDADTISGGTNHDRVTINGDYSSGVTFGTTTLTSIETLQLIAGHSYTLTTDDANVASGALLTLVANTLGAGDSVHFDGSAELDGRFVIRAGAGNDVLSGGEQSDTIRLDRGGNDTAHGNGGDDTFFLDGALTAADTLDGGSGNDRVVLNGDYSSGVTLGAATLSSVETIELTPGNDYTLTSDDANVAAGALLTVMGNKLMAGDDLNFNGSAETDGHFDLRSGAGNDTLTGGAQSDIFRLDNGGNDAAHGGGGDDLFKFDAGFTANDSVDGGSGTDMVILNGDYSAGVTFTASTMVNVETLLLVHGHDYTLTTHNATVAAGAELTVDADALGAGDDLSFDGSAETNGRFKITSGGGNDHLTGGAGVDVLDAGNGTNSLTGGGGHDLLHAGSGTDTFVYGAASDSTSVNYDTIFNFDASADFIDIPGSVNAIDTAVTTGKLGTAHFDGDLAAAIGAAQLGANDAVLFTPDSGNQAGHTFLVVDLNGTAGYQASQDIVIQLTAATNLGALATTNFV